jgi:multisubunit Na+/H+ antiporter MnhC subunit
MITILEFVVVMAVQILVLALIKTLYQDSQSRKEKKSKKQSW